MRNCVFVIGFEKTNRCVCVKMQSRAVSASVGSNKDKAGMSCCRSLGLLPLAVLLERLLIWYVQHSAQCNLGACYLFLLSVCGPSLQDVPRTFAAGFSGGWLRGFLSAAELGSGPV